MRVPSCRANPADSPFLAFQRERQTHHDANRAVCLDVAKQDRHGKALPVTTRHRGEGEEKSCSSSLQRDADAPLSPVEGETRPRDGDSCASMSER
jgi:hypothetical protein